MTQAMIPDPTALALPRSILRALRRVDLRLRTASSARGVGLAGLLASVGAFLGMGADFAGSLPTSIRWGIWGVWLVAIGLILARNVVRPLFRRTRLIDLAAVVERSDPSIGERLTGAVALLDRKAYPNGSPALIAALAEDADQRIQTFDPSTIESRPFLGRLVLGVLAVVLVAMPAVVRPDPFRTLGLRFVAPWMDLERVGWFSMTVLPGDKTVAIGSDLKFAARLAPRFGSMTGPSVAWLEWTDGEGVTHRSRMSAQPDGPAPGRSYETTLPRLAGSIQYRVSTDSSRSRSYRISAVEPPTISTITARVEPPEYTRIPAGPSRDPSRIEAIEGSRIVLEVATSSPVESIELTWPGAPQPITLRSDGATGPLPVEVGGAYVLTPRRDRHGLDGLPETRQLVVRPDAAPGLVVKGPAAPFEARPDDVLQVGVAARDDFAVASAELHYEVRRFKSPADSQAGRLDLKLDGLGSTVARGVGLLALRDLALQPGDSLAYRVRVTDNRPAPKGPNEVWSDSRALSIAATAEPIQAREDRTRRESFAARLDEIRKANQTNRRETEQLRYAADAAQRDGSAWEPARDVALAARELEARSVGDRLQLLASDLENDSTFQSLARPARQAAEVEAEAGRAQLEKARKAPSSDKRLTELRQADARLGSLAHRLDELQRKFDALAKLDGDRQKLRDLANQEDALAEQAAQAADKSKLAADQDELRKALDALVAHSPGLRAGILMAQADQAGQLARAARALADRQAQEARRTAEANRADGLLRDLAQVQRALEDDARRLALEVDEPLAENGRPRLDTDALHRAAEPIEAGNLPEAVRKIEEAEDSLRRLTRDVEDVPEDPRALARRLARRQEILAGDVNAAVSEARRKDTIGPDEQAALAQRLKPLVDRQDQIARLVAAITPPDPQKGAATEATKATGRAAENLHALRPRETEAAQNDARRTLNQLAEALADPNRRRDESRQKLDDAKRRAEDVAREIERSLADTALKPDKPESDPKAATDLAEKIAPLIQRQREAAAALTALDTDPRNRPQRDRAAARADRLANALQAVKDQAPPRMPEPRPKPPAAGWHLLGPFPTSTARPPFEVAKPVDLGRVIDGPDGKPRHWKPAPMEGDEGRINLARVFDKTENQSAFAVAEIPSASRRKTQLSIGSDDTAAIWLNGKKVFEFNGSRAFTSGQDKVDVELIEGVNRLVVRCGNGTSEWQFAVGLTPPPPDGFDPEKARQLREALAASRLDAQAALTRLEQKSQGKIPADDLAATLALEQKAAADKLAQERSQPVEDNPRPSQEATADRQRLATALRNLPSATESPALHAEAVRRAELAARPDATPEAARNAAEAAETLARRLAGTLSPAELAQALAPIEKALQAAEIRDDPAALLDRQKALDAERAHAPVPVLVAQPLAGPSPVPVDPDLGLGPDQASRAADLAVRQRQVRERLQAAMADRVTPQQALKRDAQLLGMELTGLRDRAREINARNQWQANSAAELAGHQAPQAMDKGADQLAQGRLDQARDAQRQAADLLERAAREAEDLAAGLRAEGQQAEAGGAAAESTAGLDQARDSLREVARKLAQATGTPEAASPSMRQAADSLRAAAQSRGQGPPAPPGTETGPDNPDPTAAPAGVAEADLSALQDLVRKKTGRKWGELPGHLRTEILQLSKGRYRDDYARLIQLYFREIAADPPKKEKP